MARGGLAPTPRRPPRQEGEFAAQATAEVHGFKVAATSFGVLFLAEWGDLSSCSPPGWPPATTTRVSVFVGSWLALVAVAGLAVVLGRTLLRFVRLSTIRRVGAVVCLVLRRPSRRTTLGDGPLTSQRSARSVIVKRSLAIMFSTSGLMPLVVEQLVRPGRDALGGEPGVVVLDHRDRRERLVELDGVALHAEHLAADGRRPRRCTGTRPAARRCPGARSRTCSSAVVGRTGP